MRDIIKTFVIIVGLALLLLGCKDKKKAIEDKKALILDSLKNDSIQLENIRKNDKNIKILNDIKFSVAQLDSIYAGKK